MGWQVEVNGGGFGPYTGPASGNSITPGVLSDGVYRFRAVVDNGPCNTVQSAIETVTVTDNPAPPTAGTDKALCGVIVSARQNATLPAGTGTWSYIGSVPAGRPSPTFTANSPTTTFSIANLSLAGAYTMRWSVVVGSCTFEDDVIIDFGANPAPVAPNDCESMRRNGDINCTCSNDRLWCLDHCQRPRRMCDRKLPSIDDC